MNAKSPLRLGGLLLLLIVVGSFRFFDEKAQKPTPETHQSNPGLVVEERGGHSNAILSPALTDSLQDLPSEPTISAAQVQILMNSGASQLTREEAVLFLHELGEPQNQKIVEATLLDSVDPWHKIQSWMVLVESGESIDWTDFPLMLSQARVAEVDDIYAIGAFAEWLWLSERFDEWEAFLSFQIEGMEAGDAEEILSLWRSTQYEVAAVISLLGSGSVPLNSMLVWLAGKSDEVANAILKELRAANLSKHWQMEYWKLASQAGFPGGSSLFQDIAEAWPQSPQKNYAQTLLAEYANATSEWQNLAAEGFTSGNASFRASSWLYDHPYIEAELSDLKLLEKKVAEFPSDDRTIRILKLIRQKIKVQESVP